MSFLAVEQASTAERQFLLFVRRTPGWEAWCTAPSREPALATAPLVKNSAAVIDVVAGQLRAAQAAGGTPAHVDPDLEAVSLLALSAGLGTSVLAGHSSPGQAQAVIDYNLDRLFPTSRPALRRAPMKAPATGPLCMRMIFESKIISRPRAAGR